MYDQHVRDWRATRQALRDCLIARGVADGLQCYGLVLLTDDPAAGIYELQCEHASFSQNIIGDIRAHCQVALTVAIRNHWTDPEVRALTERYCRGLLTMWALWWMMAAAWFYMSDYQRRVWRANGGMSPRFPLYFAPDMKEGRNPYGWPGVPPGFELVGWRTLDPRSALGRYSPHADRSRWLERLTPAPYSLAY